MKSLGDWPDYHDNEKVKETFVCEACKKSTEPYVTIRKEIAA